MVSPTNGETRGMAARRARLLRPRGIVRTAWNLLGAPLRMILLPDAWSNRLGFTSLEDERLTAVLPAGRGRSRDVAAGTTQHVKPPGAGGGVETQDWGGGTTIVENTRNLPFEDESFDTVTFVACLNHIPYRQEALLEARRLLRPGGRFIATMIGPFLGGIGHKIWWYSEEKHRETADEELMGMKPEHVKQLLRDGGYVDVIHRRFLYQLNHLFIATRP